MKIGITIGDVNGIGPEVALKAVQAGRGPAGAQFVFIGPAGILAEQAAALGLPDPAHPRARRTRVLDVGGPVRWRPGAVRADASRAAEQAIRRAVEGCLSGELDAMVTAPVCKEGLHQAGIPFPGHTELLAALTGARRYGMMLVGGGLRVMLATRHVALADVPGALTRQNVLEAIRLAGQALALFGVADGMIGVCGLNPHAGDGGVLGREEIDTINPAIRAARRQGFRVGDAVPADTIFHQALRGRYDAVVAMYHDQGLAPLKMLAFDRGVNVTLGLPIIRTSPDHGTAFGIAGRNEASPGSMKAAIALAIELAGKPNPWNLVAALPRQDLPSRMPL